MTAGPAAASLRAKGVPNPIVFPVIGPVEYTNDYGDARPQGRHEGNDIMAPRRALVLAAPATNRASLEWFDRWLTFPVAGDPTDVFGLQTTVGEGYVDQATGQVLTWADYTLAQKVWNTLYMLHTGQGLWWLEITLTGKDAHTGSTPMNMRVNAGLGMARITERVHQIAMGHQPGAVGAVGQVKVFPNSRNVIPGKVIFTVDIRSPDQTKLDLMRGEVERAAHAVAAELGLGCAIEAVGHFDPVTFDAGLVTVVRGAAEKLGLSHMDIISGAGHDACWINRVAPTVMVMCPCVGGLSHNEAEEISPQWAAAGTDVLFHAVLETAIVVG